MTGDGPVREIRVVDIGGQVWLYACTALGTILILNSSFQPIVNHRIRLGSTEIQEAQLNPENLSTLATLCSDGSIRLTDIRNNRLIKLLRQKCSSSARSILLRCTNIAWNHQGTQLLLLARRSVRNNSLRLLTHTYRSKW